MAGPRGEPIPSDPAGCESLPLPVAGEVAAREQLDRFLIRANGYAEARDEPAADATSHLSVYLKYGSIHPRQILARLGEVDDAADADKYRSELCWREFYADVLWHHPDRRHLIAPRHGPALRPYTERR